MSHPLRPKEPAAAMLWYLNLKNVNFNIMYSIQFTRNKQKLHEIQKQKEAISPARFLFKNLLLKGTVQRKLRGVKSGING
jgi:hypothetical protein